MTAAELVALAEALKVLAPEAGPCIGAGTAAGRKEVHLAGYTQACEVCEGHEARAIAAALRERERAEAAEAVA